MGGSDEARDSIVATFASLRSKKAIPALAKLLRDEQTNFDTRWNIAEALSEIARHRFNKTSDPIVEALAWLTAKGY